MSQITAPFTPEQVKNLNAWQQCGWNHPFTCGGNRKDAAHLDGEGVLVATEEGWICPYCDYTQKTAHDFMAEPLGPDPMEEMRAKAAAMHPETLFAEVERRRQKTFTTNAPVWVRLTPYGKKKLHFYYNQYMDVPEHQYRQGHDVREQWYKFDFWFLMNVFGDTLFNGSPYNPFVDNEVTFANPHEPA